MHQTFYLKEKSLGTGPIDIVVCPYNEAYFCDQCGMVWARKVIVLTHDEWEELTIKKPWKITYPPQWRVVHARCCNRRLHNRQERLVDGHLIHWCHMDSTKELLLRYPRQLLEYTFLQMMSDYDALNKTREYYADYLQGVPPSIL